MNLAKVEPCRIKYLKLNDTKCCVKASKRYNDNQNRDYSSNRKVPKKLQGRVRQNVSSLLVVDEEGKSIGIVTERDITRGVCIHDVLSKEFKILHLMTSPLLTINPNSSIEIAANLMLQKKVRHLIVVDGNKTVGIVTATNFIDYLNEQIEPVDPNSNVLKTLKDESDAKNTNV